jgi:hypothetical protein
MQSVRLARLLLGLIVLLAATFARQGRAWADDSCSPTATLGSSCTYVGSNGSTNGVCEQTSASFAPGCVGYEGDGGAEQADAAALSTCLTCMEGVPTSHGCGSEGPGDLSGAAFFKQPAVSGCCSVAGKSDWNDGLGLLAGACLLCLALLHRQRLARGGSKAPVR